MSDGNDFELSEGLASWVLSDSHRLARGAQIIVADLDGTLSDPSHRRHHLATRPPDWVGFSLAAGDDPPMLQPIRWLNSAGTHMPIVVISGRHSIALDITQSWLNAHHIRWDAIALRPSGDTVRGIAHKRRVLVAIMNLGLKPVLALEDSLDACEVYELEGLQCVTPSDGVLPKAIPEYPP